MTKWLNNYTRCNAQQKKSQRASEKVQAASVQVECLTFQAPRVKYRPCTSENPRGPLAFYIFSALPETCDSSFTTSSLPSSHGIEKTKSEKNTKSWMIHILYFHYHCFSHTVTYTFTLILRPGTAVLTETIALT